MGEAHSYRFCASYPILIVCTENIAEIFRVENIFILIRVIFV